MCQQQRRTLDRSCAVFALNAPTKEVLPGIEGTKVCDEAESLAAWGPRIYWDAFRVEDAYGDPESLQPRFVREPLGIHERQGDLKLDLSCRPKRTSTSCR